MSPASNTPSVQLTETQAVIAGLLQGGMKAAWEWACRQSGPWHTSDLMRALGVTPQHAANYAAELAEKHLLDRRRDDPSSGGKRFLYEVNRGL